MSNINANDLIQKEMRSFLALKGLSLGIKNSNGVVNPRKNSHSTWVGIDTKMPNSYLSSTTVGEYADAYFKGRNLDEAEHIWCPVILPDNNTDAVPEYNLISDSGFLLDDAEGFIFIKKSVALLLFGGANKELDHFELDEKVKELFNDEIKHYRAWDSDNIFDVSISTNKDTGLKAAAKDLYNINISSKTNGIMTDGIDSALIDIDNQIARAKDAVSLTLNLDIETSEKEGVNALEYVVTRLKNDFGLDLTIGHYYYDRLNKALDIVFLGRSVNTITAIRKSCEQDFDFLEAMGKQTTELVSSGDFEAINAWKVAAVLIDETSFNEMPTIMQMALIRSVFSSMTGVEIDSVVWKNS